MIKLVDKYSNPEEWNRFVKNNSEARYCHLYEYSQVMKCYGYETLHISFLKNATLVAVIPITRIRSLFFGKKWISQPFSEYGGLLIHPDLTSDEILEIIDLLRSYVSESSPNDSLEIHGNLGIPTHIAEDHFLMRNPQHLAFLKLDKPPDDMWKNTIKYEVRKAINKAVKAGLTAREECDDSEIKNEFYPLYLKSMHRLGVPPHKLDYFLSCYNAFKENMKIFWVFHDSTRISALLGYVCGKRLSISIIASDPAYWNLRPNDLLHWEFLKYASEHNIEYFDFGSIRYEGQQRFKKKWGCEIVDQNYQFLRGDVQQTRVSTYNSSSKFLSTFSSAWSKLVPLPLSRFIGPAIRKNLTR